MGTPDFAVPALDALAAAGHDIVAVYSQPPRPAGRGKAPRRGAVHRRADALGLPVKTPLSLKGSSEQADFASLCIDVAVVAAYGLILPQPVLDAPRHGCINIHASLLPRWRGAAPVQRAMLAGDSRTGITIMEMDSGLYTGSMRAVEEIEIDHKNAGQLTEELAFLGGRMIVDVLAAVDRLTPVPQPGDGVTYAAKIAKAEARLDFSQSAEQVERAIRAFNPMPGGYCEIAGERLKILAADIVEGAGIPGMIIDDRLTIACGAGALRPLVVQRPGKAAMARESLLRGWPVPAGTKAE